MNSGRIQLDPSYDNQSATFQVPERLTGWPLEAVGNWAEARLSELRLFGESRLPPSYVWAQLGACSFVAVGPRRHQLVVYPTLKIFSSGVILVQFRMISPERPVQLEEYIEHYLNAPLREFRWILTPPGLAAWAPLAIPDTTMFSRHRLPFTAFYQWYHQREVARRSRSVQMGDFWFEQALLSEANDQALLDQAVEDAQPDLERVVRDATIAAAAAQGIHLTEDYEIARIDREIQRAVAADSEEHHGFGDGGHSGGSFPWGAGEARGDNPSPPDLDGADVCPGDENQQGATVVAVDWERLEDDVRESTERRARRLGARVAKDALFESSTAKETFSGLALTIMKVAGYVAGGPRRGFGLAFLGPAMRYELINHWTGRPHTHLFRFKQQSPSAAENERRFRGAFASILARVRIPSNPPASLALPESARAFDDCGAYINMGGTLWVHGHKRHRRRSDDSTASNQNSLIYDNQVKAELLEYGYALHRRIADETIGSPSRDPWNIEDLLRARQELSDFEWAVQDTGSFGEIRELLQSGWAQYGVPRLRQRIAEALKVREEFASHVRGVAVTRWTTLIALVAGLFAIPSVVEGVLEPAWQYWGMPRPGSDDAFALVLFGVGLLIVMVLLLIGYRWAWSITLGPRAGSSDG